MSNLLLVYCLEPNIPGRYRSRSQSLTQYYYQPIKDVATVSNKLRGTNPIKT